MEVSNSNLININCCSIKNKKSLAKLKLIQKIFTSNIKY